MRAFFLRNRDHWDGIEKFARYLGSEPDWLRKFKLDKLSIIDLGPSNFRGIGSARVVGRNVTNAGSQATKIAEAFIRGRLNYTKADLKTSEPELYYEASSGLVYAMVEFKVESDQETKTAPAATQPGAAPTPAPATTAAPGVTAPQATPAATPAAATATTPATPTTSPATPAAAPATPTVTEPEQLTEQDLGRLTNYTPKKFTVTGKDGSQKTVTAYSQAEEYLILALGQLNQKYHTSGATEATKQDVKKRSAGIVAARKTYLDQKFSGTFNIQAERVNKKSYEGLKKNLEFLISQLQIT